MTDEFENWVSDEDLCLTAAPQFRQLLEKSFKAGQRSVFDRFSSEEEFRKIYHEQLPQLKNMDSVMDWAYKFLKSKYKSEDEDG